MSNEIDIAILAFSVPGALFAVYVLIVYVERCYHGQGCDVVAD